MDVEVKQRNRRRRRAQRMQAQRESKADRRTGPDSADDDDDAVVREKPQRPHTRRKKKEALVEEDIVEGFAILQFRSYEDLELVLKISSKENIKRLAEIERPKLEPKAHITHHISAHNNHGITLTQDPATSDDSGRASERLTGSSVAPRDADSSRDRLSDASSRCSSGKGYICDSEGEDDKGSDTSSVIFASTPAPRKREFSGAHPPSLPLSNGASNSPVPAPTPPNLPVPSPAPAQQPPIHPAAAASSATTAKAAAVPQIGNVAASSVAQLPPPPPAVPVSVPPVTMPQAAAAAPMAHHLDSTAGAATHAMRTDSPAVATSTNNVPVAPSAGQFHHTSYQPLYAPYAATVPSTTAASPVSNITSTASVKAPSPRVISPCRERESYSSNVSSLSRTSVTPQSCPPPTTVSSSLTMSKPWSGSTPQLSPAPPRPTPPLHSSFPPPMFTAPLPPVSRASPLTSAVPHSNPNPFSAESLFQTNQTDMLRRELDNRFLASQDRSLGVAPPPYLRTEMHQHQHHHTHVHQHTTSLLPPTAAGSLYPSPLFKDIPKLSGVESPFYRQNIGMSNYPSYTPSLIHPGLTTGPTPFVPPNHLSTFQPKSLPADPTKPKAMKSGKWNAMHVRVAWEIYRSQQKSGEIKGATGKNDLLRPPSHLFSPSVHANRPDISFPPSLSSHRPPTFDQPHASSLFTPPPSHLGKSPFGSSTMSPFTRYNAGFGAASTASPFGVSPYGSSRDLALGPLHDPWRGLQRTVGNFPPSVNTLPPTLPGLGPPNPWNLKPDPLLEQREREAREREERERERLRREREERERREREEKQRRLEQQERERREKERREMERRELERERERLLHQQRLAESAKQMVPPQIRDRSPHRNGQPETDIRIKEEPRAKEEDLLRADPRYHHAFLRHPPLQPPRMLPHSLAHYPPPPTASHWPPPPAADPFYRYEPLRYTPLVDVMRAEEERAKLFGAYSKAGLMHLRPPVPHHKISVTPPTDLHKKEEPR